MRRATSSALALLAAVAVLTGLVAVFLDRNVFSADGFARRTQQTLAAPAVSAELARRATDAAIRAEPDLVALRPLVATAAETVIRSAAFRATVRAAARDVHRSVFDGNASTVTLTVVDTGVLLSEALSHLRPGLGRRLSATLDVELTGAAETATVKALDAAERVRRLALLSLLAALAFGAGAVFTAPSRREGGRRVAVAVFAMAAVLALVASLLPRVLTGTAAARAVLETWLDPLAVWCWALFGAGLVVGMAAASILRPLAVAELLRRTRDAVARTPSSPGWRAARALAVLGAGVVAVAEPRAVLEFLVVVAGALAVVLGVNELLALGARPAAAGRRRPRRGRPVRIVALAAALLAGVAVTAFALGGDPEPVRVGRCNGQAALCERPLDQVAFVGTHNSMAADGEPGWLFAAQDAGIEAQLRDGVRALLIDTHYGFATPRGVATDLDQVSKSRDKIESQVGGRFVETAERLRKRIGYTGDSPREIFLCHAFCEVGATPALDALAGVHRFLVTHPEEVLILSIEDDTAAADTAELIRASGLIREVYRGPARPPWPTLGELVARDERVLVLIENDPGREPWMHEQSAVMQETPYRFNTAAELAAPTTCEPNRGGTDGSLLLVNHWVDTSPAPRKTIAREVNAPAVLGERLRRCRSERGLRPTVVAVDFYRQGGVFATVDGYAGGG